MVGGGLSLCCGTWLRLKLVNPPHQTTSNILSVPTDKQLQANRDISACREQGGGPGQ